MTEFDQNNQQERQYRKVWGRRQTRPLKASQKCLLKDLYPQIQIDLGQERCLEGSIDPTKFFPGFNRFCLEIGFGGGEHLAWRAQQSPDIGFIGCEPFLTGVATLVDQIHENDITNIRIANDDARLLAHALPTETFERIYVLFPDPWHKKRHHKRRIIHDDTISDLSRILKKGGELVMATDIAEYAEWMQDVLSKRSEFISQMGNRTSLQERPEHWPLTRYEQKGIDAGRQATFMVYRKI